MTDKIYRVFVKNENQSKDFRVRPVIEIRSKLNFKISLSFTANRDKMFGQTYMYHLLNCLE